MLTSDQTAQLDEVLVRELLPSDAEEAAALSAELGYPVPAEMLRSRLEGFRVCSDHVIYAACVVGHVVGWIDVGVVHHLVSEPYGEIGGLIVSAGYRGQGIGRKLMACAELWIAGRGFNSVLVRSRVSREAAHAFYLAQDYRHIKTSVVFMKQLPKSE